MTTDYTLDSHGTHTTGTAGGAYTGNGYQGAATECELVLCGLDSLLYDTDIINSVAYIFNYANSVNKPAVVSLSISSQQGPHDGTSPNCLALDNLAKEGNIIVLAASNDALSTLYLHKKFTASDKELSTILFNNYNQEPGYYKNCYIDTWSRNSQSLGIKFNVIAFANDPENNIKMGDILASSPLYFPRTEADSIFSWDSNKDIELAKYFTGNISVSGGIDAYNNKFNLFTSIDMISTKYKSDFITMTLSGDEGTEFDTWEVDTKIHFGDFGLTGYVSGSGEVSISDMATGYNTISVGAYTSRLYYKTLLGNTLSLYGNKAIEKDIAPFSSYGIDLNGRPHPDVTAPGSSVISSFNSFDTTTTPSIYGCYKLPASNTNKEYIWGAQDGTSMSTPLVAGSIALWLEANPRLSPSDIHSIIKETSYQDDFTASGNLTKWGAGKFDAYSGLLKAIELSGVPNTTSENTELKIFPNPSNGKFSIYAPCNDSNAKLEIYSSNGTLIYKSGIITTNNATFDVNMENKLTDGLYILRISSSTRTFNGRLFIRK